METAAGPVVYRSAPVNIAGAQPRPFGVLSGDLHVPLAEGPPLRLPSSVGSDGDGRCYASPPSGADFGRGASAGPSPVTLAIDGISQTLIIGGSSRQATRLSAGALPLKPVGPAGRELGANPNRNPNRNPHPHPNPNPNSNPNQAESWARRSARNDTAGRRTVGCLQGPALLSGSVHHFSYAHRMHMHMCVRMHLRTCVCHMCPTSLVLILARELSIS